MITVPVAPTMYVIIAFKKELLSAATIRRRPAAACTRIRSLEEFYCHDTQSGRRRPTDGRTWTEGTI